jgi:hypothetical protein
MLPHDNSLVLVPVVVSLRSWNRLAAITPPATYAGLVCCDFARRATHLNDCANGIRDHEQYHVPLAL